MKKKLFVTFSAAGIIFLLLGAVAVETVEWLQESRTVSSTSDIFYAYLDARDDLPPLPLPMGAEGVLSYIEADDWSFLDDHWFVNQPGSTLYVPADSKLAKQVKLPLQILVIEDISRGEITIYYEDKKRGWKGLALFEAPPILDETAPFYTKSTDEEKQQDLFWNLNATRVRWTVTLKPESEILTDFVFQRDAAVASMSLLEEAGMMAMMSVPAEHTNDIFVSGEPVANGLYLEVYCPSGVTNIEIYRCTDLTASDWGVEKNGLLAVNTNTVYWTVSTAEDTGFFVAGNGGLDSDNDLLCDARELYVCNTSTNDADSDNDSLSDGEEVLIYETNPLSNDTEGDGMHDGWEVANNLNPLSDDSSDDPDGDGVQNQLEFLLGRNPHAGILVDTNAMLKLTIYNHFE